MNFFKNWLDGLNLLFYMTQRIEPFFPIKLKGLDFILIFKPFSTIALNDWPCFEHDSQNWTFLFKMTQRIEHMTWLRENEPDFQNLTQRIEPSSQKDSKNWTLKDHLIPTTKPSYDSWKWFFLYLNQRN